MDLWKFLHIVSMRVTWDKTLKKTLALIYDAICAVSFLGLDP